MAPDTVYLLEEDSYWFVVHVEDGVETRRPFLVREHAVSCMIGQRIRLGLPVDPMVNDEIRISRD